VDIKNDAQRTSGPQYHHVRLRFRHDIIVEQVGFDGVVGCTDLSTLEVPYLYDFTSGTTGSKWPERSSFTRSTVSNIDARAMGPDEHMLPSGRS
jgi:hypothetical protein